MQTVGDSVAVVRFQKIGSQNFYIFGKKKNVFGLWKYS